MFKLITTTFFNIPKWFCVGRHTLIGIIGPRSRLKEMQRCLEEVLDTMTVWFRQNGMLVNASKTEFIVCGDSRQLARLESFPTINFMGEVLHSKKDVKNRNCDGL